MYLRISVVNNMRVTDLGCWRPLSRHIRYLQFLPGVSAGGTGQDVTSRCFHQAMRKGYNCFAVLSDGRCLSHPLLCEEYQKGGQDTTCSAHAMHVYKTGKSHNYNLSEPNLADRFFSSFCFKRFTIPVQIWKIV